jgi:DNA invertase Pin-like site-specific DNA recombinase
VFADLGQSAYRIDLAERTAGRELFKVMKRVDLLIAAKQDRVWRCNRDRENSMFYLRQTGIDFAILDVSLDTSTAAGKFAAGIISLQSQWESDVRSERGKAAHEVRKRRRTPGRKNPPPGWRWDKVREELVPDMKERKLIETIMRWRLQKVRQIVSSCRWLDEEGIRRDNGAKYTRDWVTRAHYSLKNGWPQEGYVQARWKGTLELNADESMDDFRLPQIAGKKQVHFRETPRGLRDSAADRNWICEAYRAAAAATSGPDEMTLALPVRGPEC